MSRGGAMSGVVDLTITGGDAKSMINPSFAEHLPQ